MKAATERKIMRWLHLILSIPIIGFIYGPVADIPEAAFATRFVFVPIVILSGIYMWKGHLLRKFISRKV
ncbi:MAG: hypothetical protein J7604_10050 [Sporocytophaga sp.]|uniref:hypothetical protein n=1 Tax=Sporocytophaga sp. TaxID=2231183 RepID=UPI001B18C95D|nr:hypothetical protein [Sporocytophaga sp.]MBO9700539.1 hypothetical protein [Sporocytophaga sp.]